MPLVMANEPGTGQTEAPLRGGSDVGFWTRVLPRLPTGSLLESSAIKGDSPVPESRKVNGEYPEYGSSNLESEFGSHLDPILNTP